MHGVPEKLDPQRVASLTAQIKADGDVTTPLLIDGRNRELRDGHHRYAAAKALGLRSVPVDDISKPKPK
jgi:ParB-like chromosome segregation protein Spo0J